MQHAPVHGKWTVRAGIAESRIAEIAVPWGVRDPVGLLQTARGDPEVAEILHEGRAELRKVQRPHIRCRRRSDQGRASQCDSQCSDHDRFTSVAIIGQGEGSPVRIWVGFGGVRKRKCEGVTPRAPITSSDERAVVPDPCVRTIHRRNMGRRRQENRL
jgi:hypothetical protein